MILVSKTYWGHLPFWFRGRTPENARVQSLVLRTDDFRQIRANWWTRADAPEARVGVVLMHPRVDFSHHYAVPALVAAGFGVLAANSRHLNNDTSCEHEELVVDLAAAVKWIRGRGGVKKVVLFGNSGGGSLAAFYQSQAKLPPGERLETSPGGSPTRFAGVSMQPADGLLFVATHRGQGQVLLHSIDPSVVDEADAFATDGTLDMYDARNGFAEPPAPSRYAKEFVARYREAQIARVRRLDVMARASIDAHTRAAEEAERPGFAARPFAERQAVLRRRAHEPVMVVHRTMANPNYTDPTLDPSPREYGSLLSDRPDLMNMASLGFARTVTPRAWLSTWSGLSTNADLVKNVANVTVPTLFVHAERDREVFWDHDMAPAIAASGAKDKTVHKIPARHYFEPDFGEKDAPDVDRLMKLVVPWITERFQ